MDRIFSPHLILAKKLWREHLRPGDGAIDATCGNGNDTLFLSELLSAHPESYVYGYDLQSAAIESTRKLVPSERVRLFRQSHETFGPLPHPPRLIIYNLGYLPKGDKSIVTQTASTLKSVGEALSILAEGGALSITCYPGHDEGQKEEAALLDFLAKLPSSSWQVQHHRWLNRPRSPSLLWILKTSQ